MTHEKVFNNLPMSQSWHSQDLNLSLLKFDFHNRLVTIFSASSSYILFGMSNYHSFILKNILELNFYITLRTILSSISKSNLRQSNDLSTQTSHEKNLIL